MTPVCIVDTPGYSSQCEALATQLQLPIIANEAENPKALQLSYQQDRLQLLAPGSIQGSGPVYVDFVHGKLAHRKRFGGGKGQAIAKAVGLKPTDTPSVLDATAGLGQDAYILASLGCEVVMCERNPIIAALLRDGLQRASVETDTIIQRMHFIQDDAEVFMTRASHQPTDVVYLDPMYPARKGTALTQKGMQTLQILLGHSSSNDEDSLASLLSMARKFATKRIVLKRPAKVSAIADPKPAFCVPGKTTRYDVWLPF